MLLFSSQNFRIRQLLLTVTNIYSIIVYYSALSIRAYEIGGNEIYTRNSSKIQITFQKDRLCIICLSLVLEDGITMSYKINYYCASKIGNCRRTNQDNFICDRVYLDCYNMGTEKTICGTFDSKNTSVFGVFDGMGGEEQGEMAAYIAAKKLADFVFDKEPEQGFVEYSRLANKEICTYIEQHSLTSMGTTSAILSFSKAKIYLCNIGDSKIFRFSDGVLRQISYDHVSVSAYGTKPPLSQNLGIPENELIISPYISSCDYRNNDIYLICSDGLTDMVSVADIEQTLKNTAENKTADVLVQKALNIGGKDNITLILLCVRRRRFGIIDKILGGKRHGHGNE